MIEGEGKLTQGGELFPISKGANFILPAETNDFTIEGTCELTPLDYKPPNFKNLLSLFIGEPDYFFTIKKLNGLLLKTVKLFICETRLIRMFLLS